MWQRVKTLMIGFVVGAGLGAVTSLLLAPDSGDGLRNKAKSEYKRLLTESAQAADLRREELRAKLAEKIQQPSES